MNQLEIRTLARDLIAESSTTLSYTTDTIFNRFIYDGVRDLCVKGHVYEKTISITVANTVATYKLPWDFIAPNLLLNHNGAPLDPIDSNMVGRIYLITGIPLYFDISHVDVTITTRANTTAYVVWPATCVHTLTYTIPATANGYLYECTIAGTTAGAPVVLGTTLGGTTADGGVTWTCRELLESLYQLNLYDTPLTASSGTGTYSFTYYAMDGGLAADTSAPNIPVDKHLSISYYLAYRHFLRSKDIQLAAVFYKDYCTMAGLPVPKEVPQIAS